MWARVRVWRGLFVKISADVTVCPYGSPFGSGPTGAEAPSGASPAKKNDAGFLAGRRLVGFAAPAVSFEFEANPGETDPGKDAWSFHARGSAAEALFAESRRLRGSSGKTRALDPATAKELAVREADEKFVEDRLAFEFLDPAEVAKRRRDEDREAAREALLKKKNAEARRKAEWREQTRRAAEEKKERTRAKREERLVLAKEKAAERRDVGEARRRQSEEAKAERRRARESAEDERRMIKEAEAERVRLERAARRAETSVVEKKNRPPKKGSDDDVAEKKADANAAPPSSSSSSDDASGDPGGSVAAVGGLLDGAGDSPAALARAEAAPAAPSGERSVVAKDAGAPAAAAADADGTGGSTRSVFFGGDAGDAESERQKLQKLRSEDKKAKEAARAAERAEAKAAAEKQERLREETRRRAERELKDIAAAAEKRARDAAKAAKAAKRREARDLKMAKVREKEEAAAILEERKAWERAEARTRSEREKVEKKEEENRRRAEKAAAFAEERERKAERARVLSSLPEERETAAGDAYDVGRVDEDDDSYSGYDANAVALVPGHWIDPGEETGSPGERELNARIADKAHDELVLRGWTVLRPDCFVPPLDWDAYLDWARAQCARGVPLLEIHGQGSGAEMRGQVTGVISQTGVSEISGASLSPLGDALAERFGRFPMDWRELVVSRVGGAVVESFETEVLERMPLKKREAAMDAIALDIADAVDSTRFTSTPPDDGCSASGCPRA